MRFGPLRRVVWPGCLLLGTSHFRLELGRTGMRAKDPYPLFLCHVIFPKRLSLSVALVLSYL